MSTTNYHMSMNIRGALRNKQALRAFTNDDGSRATPDEARKFLEERLADGWEVIPLGDCPTFDKKTGCPGHPVEAGLRSENSASSGGCGASTENKI